jgi:c-di-GMP-binding flagellar brake protein YcgR
MGREDFIPADGLNISATGLACITDVPQESGSRMFTMFQLDPDSEESLVKCEGVVSRCDKKPNGEYEIGVEFTDILDSDRKKIEVYLAQ